MTELIEIRKIVPPSFKQVNLGERILCYRPMKHGMPHLGIEQKGSKVIAHNYGHGGSGWTLGQDRQSMSTLCLLIHRWVMSYRINLLLSLLLVQAWSDFLLPMI